MKGCVSFRARTCSVVPCRRPPQVHECLSRCNGECLAILAHRKAKLGRYALHDLPHELQALRNCVSSEAIHSFCIIQCLLANLDGCRRIQVTSAPWCRLAKVYHRKFKLRTNRIVVAFLLLQCQVWCRVVCRRSSFCFGLCVA